MRIVLVSPLPPSRDGIAAYTAGVAAAYRAAGHEVTFVTPEGTPPAAGTDPAPASFGRNPALAGELAARIAAGQPALVHVQHAIATYGTGIPALFALVRAVSRHGIPVVITHHEVTRDTAKLRLPGRQYYQAISELATAVHVHTAAAAARLRQCHVPGERIIVHPHPIFPAPAPAASPALAAQIRCGLGPGIEHLIGMIGYLQRDKGYLQAIAALARALERRPALRAGTRLVLAGEVRPRPAGFGRFEQADRQYADAVRTQVSRLGLADVVLWRGHVPDEEFTAWFQALDLLLLPYTAAEESGIAAHAIATGTPLLASGAGGLGELFGGTAIALPSIEQEPFASTLLRVLASPDAHRTAACHVYDQVRRDRDPAGLVAALTAAASPAGGPAGGPPPRTPERTGQATG